MNNPLKLVYIGTPDFSARFLEKVLGDKNLPVTVQLVVTQPDKPVGRKKIVTPSPVGKIALKQDIPIYTELDAQCILELQNADLALVFAYGKIISTAFLRAPKYGFWNVHPSLLPTYRGASPTTYPLVLGDKETGVTLMKMDEKLDHGPVIIQEETKIKEHETNSELRVRLTDMAYEMFESEILKLTSSTTSDQLRPVKLTEQDYSKATFTRMLTKEDGYIEFNLIKKALNNEAISKEELPTLITDYIENNKKSLNTEYSILNTEYVIYNMYRGLHPWPGIWTKVMIDDQEKRLKILDLKLKDGKIELKKVQLEGKKPVDFKQFNKHFRIF